MAKSPKASAELLREVEAAERIAALNPPGRIGITLETIFAGKTYADINASPLQRAICRAASGRPLQGVLPGDDVEKYFGTYTPGIVPKVVTLLCGVRGGKSWIAACAAIYGCLHVDLSQRKKHELARFVIIAPIVDTAEATFNILVGILQNGPSLKHLVDGEPTADTVVIKRPDGYRIEIKVVAASRGGITVRNRWLAGFVLEEVAQFGDAGAGAVISAEEMLSAAEKRLLPRAQGWLISSPYGPTGLLWDTYRAHFGKNDENRLVVHAPTWVMNPSFPKSDIDRAYALNPDSARREYGAEFLDAESSFFESARVDDAMRKGRPLILPLPLGCVAAAGMDSGTRGNAWTLAITGRVGRKAICFGVWQWIGSKASPLSPNAVLKEIAEICFGYGILTVDSDQVSFDANNDHALQHGIELRLAPSAENTARYGQLRTEFLTGDIEIPDDPVLRADLLGVKKRATAGNVRIELARTADGRHCDYAPALALSVAGARALDMGHVDWDALREMQDAMPKPFGGNVAW